MHLAAKVLAVSDGVHDGTRDDSARPEGRRSGSTTRATTVVDHRVTADGIDEVAAALRDLADGFAGLVVTTGGTGFGPRDLTPEGTRAGDRARGARPRRGDPPRQRRRRARPSACSAAACAAPSATAIVCNLPGSSNGALEGLEVILPACRTPSTSSPAAAPTDLAPSSVPRLTVSATATGGTSNGHADRHRDHRHDDRLPDRATSKQSTSSSRSRRRTRESKEEFGVPGRVHVQARARASLTAATTRSRHAARDGQVGHRDGPDRRAATTSGNGARSSSTPTASSRR